MLDLGLQNSNSVPSCTTGFLHDDFGQLGLDLQKDLGKVLLLVVDSSFPEWKPEPGYLAV